MVYSGDEFYGDDETSGGFMGCETCGRYECPGYCEEPDDPDVDAEPVTVLAIIPNLNILDELPY